MRGAGDGEGTLASAAPLTILQVHNRYRDPGGEDVAVDAEAEMLTAAGHHVVTWSASNDRGLRAVASLAAAPWNPQAARRARRLAAQANPDVAHVHNTWFALSPAVLRALHDAGVPVVMTLHNYRLACVSGVLFRDGHLCHDCLGTHPWRGVVHRCHRGSVVSSAAGAATIALNRALGTWSGSVDHFIAVSELVRRTAEQTGLDSGRVTVLPNMIRDPGPRASPPSRSRTLLFVGRLAPNKGVGTLLEAWRRRRSSTLELAIAGGGPELGFVRDSAPPDVRVLERLQPGEIPGLMLSSRALLYPSVLPETFGRVIAEAMAAGLPVLGSPAGGAAELLAAFGPRWSVPPGDVDAWVEGLARLESDDAVDAAGVTGRAYYQAKLDPDATLAGLLDVYRTAAARRASERPGSTVGA